MKNEVNHPISLHEQISAAMDGELDSSEYASVAQLLCENDQARGRWGRYHLISMALMDETSRWPELNDRDENAFLKAPLSSPMQRKRWQAFVSGAAAAMLSSVFIGGVLWYGYPGMLTQFSSTESPPMPAVQTDQDVNQPQARIRLAGASSDELNTASRQSGNDALFSTQLRVYLASHGMQSARITWMPPGAGGYAWYPIEDKLMQEQSIGMPQTAASISVP